jgi:hypothetical protein
MSKESNPEFYTFHIGSKPSHVLDSLASSSSIPVHQRQATVTPESRLDTAVEEGLVCHLRHFIRGAASLYYWLLTYRVLEYGTLA